MRPLIQIVALQHIVFASVWGYYIGRAYLCRRALGRTIIAALACTAILHGLYDYVVIAMPVAGLTGRRIADPGNLGVAPVPDSRPAYIAAGALPVR